MDNIKISYQCPALSLFVQDNLEMHERIKLFHLASGPNNSLITLQNSDNMFDSKIKLQEINILKVNQQQNGPLIAKSFIYNCNPHPLLSVSQHSCWDSWLLDSSRLTRISGYCCPSCCTGHSLYRLSGRYWINFYGLAALSSFLWRYTCNANVWLLGAWW